MSTGPKLLLVLALLAVGGFVAALLLWTGSPAPPSQALRGTTLRPPLDSGPAEPVREETRSTGGVFQPTAAELPETTVTAPLRLELELVRATGRLAAEGVPQRGSGARARLRGGLFGSDQRGVSGEVVFVAGANAGRVLEVDENGAFGANDLYPGLSIVELRSVGLPGSQREVRLRNDRETQLNVGFGRPATLYGEVIDREGEAIPYATVTIDGQRATTDEEGVFHFPRMTSGQVLAVVQKAGYASYRELLNVSAATTVPIGKIKFMLEPGATLQVTVQQRVGADEDALLYIEPDHDLQAPGALFQRKYPWHLLNPVSVPPGGTATIEDLPAQRVRLRLFHAGAAAKPAVQSVNLSSGAPAHATFELQPARMLRGRVLEGGDPVRGALVRLEVPDQAAATAKVLGAPLAILESSVRPNLPPAVQTTYTDGRGEFVFSAAEDIAPVRYLTARGPRDEGWAGRVVRPGETQVELTLEDRPEPTASLRLETLPRTQPLPLDVRVDGAPRDLPLLPVGEQLVLDSIPPGVWRVHARWRDQQLLEPTDIEIEEQTELFIPLPDEARDGPAAAAAGGR
jgi:hypothetical protein